MPKNLPKTRFGLIIAGLVLGAAVLPLLGSEHHGVVKFGGLPLPGASVTAKPMNAKEGDKSFSAITDLDGNYSFADLPDGTWTIQVEMPLFSPMEQEVTVGRGSGRGGLGLEAAPGRSDPGVGDGGSPASGRGNSGGGRGSSRECASQGENTASRAHQYCNCVSAHGLERSARCGQRGRCRSRLPITPVRRTPAPSASARPTDS